jgi:hypothetical protein
MPRSILLLIPAAGLLGLLVLGVVHGARWVEDDPGLAFVRLDLDDGRRWILGEGGIGRPFLARLVLANNAKNPIKIWHPLETEGSGCARVVLTDALGRETVLQPPIIPRFAGVAMGRTIAPSEVLTIELELLRLIDVNAPPPPGDYKIQAFYESPADPETKTRGIWTGTLHSDAIPITIVAPPPPRKPR